MADTGDNEEVSDLTEDQMGYLLDEVMGDDYRRDVGEDLRGLDRSPEGGTPCLDLGVPEI